MESNYIKDGWSHILHTFDWFDNELYMQIHIDDIEWLCKFFILQYCCCSISFICSRILLFFFLNLLILINIDIMHTGWIFKNWKINRKLFDCERSMRFNIYKKFFSILRNLNFFYNIFMFDNFINSKYFLNFFKFKIFKLLNFKSFHIMNYLEIFCDFIYVYFTFYLGHR